MKYVHEARKLHSVTWCHSSCRSNGEYRTPCTVPCLKTSIIYVSATQKQKYHDQGYYFDPIKALTRYIAFLVPWGNKSRHDRSFVWLSLLIVGCLTGQRERPSLCAESLIQLIMTEARVPECAGHTGILSAYPSSFSACSQGYITIRIDLARIIRWWQSTCLLPCIEMLIIFPSPTPFHHRWEKQMLVSLFRNNYAHQHLAFRR